MNSIIFERAFSRRVSGSLNSRSTFESWLKLCSLSSLSLMDLTMWLKPLPMLSNSSFVLISSSTSRLPEAVSSIAPLMALTGLCVSLKVIAARSRLKRRPTPATTSIWVLISERREFAFALLLPTARAPIAVPFASSIGSIARKAPRDPISVSPMKPDPLAARLLILSSSPVCPVNMASGTEAAEMTPAFLSGPIASTDAFTLKYLWMVSGSQPFPLRSMPVTKAPVVLPLSITGTTASCMSPLVSTPEARPWPSLRRTSLETASVDMTGWPVDMAFLITPFISRRSPLVALRLATTRPSASTTAHRST